MQRLKKPNTILSNNSWLFWASIIVIAVLILSILPEHQKQYNNIDWNPKEVVISLRVEDECNAQNLEIYPIEIVFNSDTVIVIEAPSVVEFNRMLKSNNYYRFSVQANKLDLMRFDSINYFKADIIICTLTVKEINGHYKISSELIQLNWP